MSTFGPCAESLKLGRAVVGACNSDQRVDPVGSPLLLGGIALDIAEKTNIERGIITKNTVKGFHPSINTALRLTDNLQLRFSFAKSIYVYWRGGASGWLGI